MRVVALPVVTALTTSALSWLWPFIKIFLHYIQLIAN